MRDEVVRYMEEKKMLRRGDAVIAAVSGGADSMALLHLLFDTRKQLGIQLVAAHVNHGLRGREADRDEAFAEEWCQRHEIPFFAAHCSVREEARKWKLGEEACGRELRYSFFHMLARLWEDGGLSQQRSFQWKWDGKPLAQGGVTEEETSRVKIATAHTLSDNAETLFLHLARGTGLKGLEGIPPVRNGIIRPLLCVSRAQVEEYCRENGLSYVTDSSNLSLAYSRNQVRAKIIPGMMELNPAFLQAAGRLMTQVEETENYFSKKVEETLARARCGEGCFRREPFLQLEPAEGSRAVIRLAEELGGEPEQRHVAALLECIRRGGGAVTFPGNLTLLVNRKFILLHSVHRYVHREERMELRFPLPETMTFAEKRLEFRVEENNYEGKNLKIYKKLLSDSLNYDTIPNSMILRTWLSGDVFYQAGRGVGKTVKKLFNELRVPLEERNRLLILEGGGRILWIEGVGVSEGAQVSQDTKRILRIFVRRMKG